MTTRRRFVVAWGGAAFVPRGWAQPRGAHIGYLVYAPLIDPPSPERAAFVDELRKLGHAVGEGLRMEYRSAENEPEFLAALARELVGLNVDVIVATHVEAALAAARA